MLLLGTLDMTSEEKQDLLLGKIDGILKLLALQTTAGRKTGDAALLLDRAGLERKLIAQVLGTTQDSIRGLINQGKRKANNSAEEG